MSDGTTAIQVSPTEDDAMKLAEIFNRAANAIVNASTLPAQVAALTARVQELQDQLSQSQLHASELDATIHELRQQRDAAREERAAVARDRDEVNESRSYYITDRDYWQGQCLEAQAALRAANEARETAELNYMEMEDVARAAQQELSEMQAALRRMLPEPPRSIPVNEPTEIPMNVPTVDAPNEPQPYPDGSEAVGF